MNDMAASDGAKMHQPLVSIIIPFYNLEQFLAEAIESVLRQTYANWELLLVDDGSKDRSRNVAEEYCRSHRGRMRCLEHPGKANRGLSETRNLGWREAKGQLIAFLDGDDCWFPTKLAHQVAIFEREHDVEICVGASLYWREWRGAGRDGIDEVLPVGGPQDRSSAPGELATELYPLGKGRAPSMNTLVMRREIYAKTGMFEPCFRRSFEDQAFLIKAYLNCTVFIMSEVLDRYRQGRDQSITELELRTAKKFDRNIEFFTWLESYLLAFGPSHAALAKTAREKVRVHRRKKWRYLLQELRARLGLHRARVRR